jgi:signal transduction histidine kinase
MFGIVASGEARYGFGCSFLMRISVLFHCRHTDSHNIPDVIPVHLVGDPFRLKQILMNLIGNAVKFTLEGRMNVFVRIISEMDLGKLKLEFTVLDTGIGISPEKLEDIFINFYQADNSNTRKHGGTGLGLAISKQLVNMMSGDIRVESVLGKGSSFHFTCVFEEIE